MLSRLGMLKEHVDATEAMCGLELDRRRNELVAFDLVGGRQCRPMNGWLLS